jgi:ABC-type multidrug transport system permease subunit
VNKLETQPVSISGSLASEGTGVAGKAIVLNYFDGTQWIQIAVTSTGADGVYLCSWAVPSTLANGQYAIKAEFVGDSYYLESSATTGTIGNGGHLFVLPEYLWGGLAALIACFVALVVFKNRGRLSRKLSVA